MGHVSRPGGGTQLYIRLCRMIAKHANVCSENLPPAAAREVRNLQNFFPFPWRKEEEEALEDDDLAADCRKDDPDVDPVGFLD